MSKHFELTAEVRHQVGKGASRRLRRESNKVPGIIYGAGKEPTLLSFEHHKVLKVIESEAFFSSILTIDVDGTKEQAVLKDMQRHPFKPRVLHLDFLRINSSEKLTMHIPLHFIGEDIAPGVKKDGGIVNHIMTDLEIKCLPADLPEYISVDISGLELDGTIHLSQVKLPKGVELATPIEDPEHDVGVVSIHMPRAVEEEIPTTAPVASEVPATQQSAPVEEAAPAGKEGKKEGKKE
ncbi:MAG: 50S ribosomal protein L25/general stress protein Ctc [Proteobacteria bacterium]|nr:50S ribosomal protein L25/general stress protein Ctc [Pseudomonadota bacterium]